jgi:hypothetical protein
VAASSRTEVMASKYCLMRKMSSRSFSTLLALCASGACSGLRQRTVWPTEKRVAGSVRSRWARADGRRIHWIETSRGRPVVLLPGLGHSAQARSHVVPALLTDTERWPWTCPDSAARRRILGSRSSMATPAFWPSGLMRSLADRRHWSDIRRAAYLAASRPDMLSGMVCVAPAGIVETSA